MIFKRKIKDKILVCTMVLSLLLSVNPIYSFGEEKREVVDIPSGASFYHKEMIGKDRYETSNKILKEMGDKNETVILVNASEIMSDGLSSSALAGKLKANIVPINPKKVNKNTMEKVKKAKTVYLIGGYNAIPKSFESNLKNKKVIRIGGKDRVETSEKIAKYIGSYKKAYIVNGYTGQADAMSISPVAARDLSPIILTKKSNSETPKKDNVEYTVIGGKNAVSEKIRKRFSSKRIDGKDRYETNRNVLKKFYPNRKSISFCNGETLVDALSGTVYAKDEGIALVNRKNNLDLLEYISTSQLGGLPFDVNFVYGGSGGTGGSGGSSGSGGGTGGGPVVTNKAPSAPEISANQTDEYKDNDKKRKVEIKITKESEDPEGDKVTYEYDGKSADDFYEVGKTYTVKVRAKDSKDNYSDWSNKATFTVNKKVENVNKKPSTPTLNHELIENYNPKDKTMREVKLIAKSTDPEQDAITYEYQKKVNGKYENVEEKSFYKEGMEHIVRARAKDSKGNYSEWSDDYTFTVPKKLDEKYAILLPGAEIHENPDNPEEPIIEPILLGKINEIIGENKGNIKIKFEEKVPEEKFENIKKEKEYKTLDVNKGEIIGYLEGNKVVNIISQKEINTNPNASFMFAGLNIKSIEGLENIDTHNTTNMMGMFDGCKELTSLNLSNFDTSQVTNMSYMFSGCEKLTILDLINFDTSRVTDMSSMFSFCEKLTNLNLSNFNTSQVTNMSKMFLHYGYEQTDEYKQDLDLRTWDTSKVTDMSEMFDSSKLKTLNVSDWNTSKVTNMSEMFDSSTLNSLNLKGWDTSNVTNMSQMFYECRDLTTLNLSDWNTSNVTNMSLMFYNSTIENLNLSNWDTGNITNMSLMFSSSNLKTLDVSNWDTSNVTNMSQMFDDCIKLTSLDLSTWDTSKVTDMNRMFKDNESLQTLNVSSWDTGNVENMDYMFSTCIALKDLQLGNFNKTTNTNTKKSMEGLFSKCNSLTTLDLSGWKTDNVTNMSSMFYGCRHLTTLDLSSWNTSNVTNMSQMFEVSSSNDSNNEEYLEKLDLSGWDTSKVTDMSSMFRGRYKLKTLDLSKWDTSGVTDMPSMFWGCGNLPNIVGIGNFDFSSVKNMESIFESCFKLRADIYIKNKNTGTIDENECKTKDAFKTSYTDDLKNKIIVHYDANNTDVRNFIENNLSKNNPSNDPFYNVEYKVIKNDAPTM